MSQLHKAFTDKTVVIFLVSQENLHALLWDNSCSNYRFHGNKMYNINIQGKSTRGCILHLRTHSPSELQRNTFRLCGTFSQNSPTDCAGESMKTL